MSREAFDAVVCGGGTGGAVVAARVAEAGLRVLVLEAGPDYGAFASGRWPRELLDATTIPTSHDWGYTSGDEYPGRVLEFERARVIGGCSAHNGCTISWGHRVDYDGWAARGLEGWSAEELLPLFREASRRLRVRRFGDEEIAPLHRAFIDAGVGMGFPEEDRLESLDARPAVCTEPSNSPDGVRWNAAFAYLDPARARPELEIRGGVLVDRLLIRGSRAEGVRALGPDGVFEVAADLVVVAGGTYGSPAMLLRSGLGPADELRAMEIEPLADLPGVGRNLHDHPSFELSFAPSEELERRTAEFARSRPAPDEQGFAMAASSAASGGVFDLHVFPEVVPNRGPGIFSALLTPHSRGRLTLTSADPAAAPALDHAYLTDPEDGDVEALLDGVELAREFAARPELAPLFDGEIEPGPPAVSREALREAIRRGVVHYWHPVGTCAMGPKDEAEAVCDSDGRIHGMENVVVADASVMPATVRATTNLPVVVVAERIARSLVAGTLVAR